MIPCAPTTETSLRSISLRRRARRAVRSSPQREAYSRRLTGLACVCLLAGCGGQALVLDRDWGQQHSKRLYALATTTDPSVDPEAFDKLTQEAVRTMVSVEVVEGFRAQPVASSNDIPSAELERAVIVSSRITKYDEGSALLRLLLPGLGQMHLHVEIVLTSASTGESVNQGNIRKRYAGGNLIGAFATMEDDIIRRISNGIRETTN